MTTGESSSSPSSSSKRGCGDSNIGGFHKKPRTDSSPNVSVTSHAIDSDRIFVDFPKSLVNALNIALDSLMDESTWMGYISLTPLKILNSNATDCHEGYRFSKAYCSSEKYPTQYSFGSVFIKGLSILIEFILHRTIPENKQDKFVLGKLLHFLSDSLDTDAEALKNMEMYTETELNTVVTNHLFAKLSTSTLFTIDKQLSKSKCRGNERRGYLNGKPWCPCEQNECLLSGDYGDTSIGNWMVWHGSVDVVINHDVIIVSQDNEDENCCHGDKPPAETKSSVLRRNHQIIAQNIVFSFLQKHRHPESDNFLIPCIGITREDIIVYLYDSVHDVLLESSLLPLQGMVSSPGNKLNLVAVLVSWLVVNYKYLCGGVMEEMKTTKAEFFSQAKEKLSIYETYLKSGDVRNTRPTVDSGDQVKNLHHPLLIDLKKRNKLVVLEPRE
ncbi:uncharacterized protein LOC117334577 [Pecten maximus]|uniref:uncharacterized protein LOC117334577 n=1 Tax=Pecten maximus TaxID=6579 RepID=UPI0014582C41|nr:uncharacterized protein LOC117334577 [Pecten maximus]